MLTLGVETSGRSGSVAICRDGTCLAERPLEKTGRRHAQTLVLEVERILADLDLCADECELVAVSIGPGSFTGLRVGVVFAKTFAYANRCDIAAVDTLACIATTSPSEVNTVYVVDDAQRGELFVGHYTKRPDGHWIATNGIELHNAVRWFAARTTEDVVTGPGVEKYMERYASTCRILAPEYRTARASVVAKLGQLNFESIGADDFWMLEPFYFRKSAAEEKWEAHHHLKEPNNG